jgi:hypothetical protein
MPPYAGIRNEGAVLLKIRDGDMPDQHPSDDSGTAIPVKEHGARDYPELRSLMNLCWTQDPSLRVVMSGALSHRKYFATPSPHGADSITPSITVNGLAQKSHGKRPATLPRRVSERSDLVFGMASGGKGSSGYTTSADGSPFSQLSLSPRETPEGVGFAGSPFVKIMGPGSS